MEAVECLLIFVYGITNVFLEHLSAWGGEWAPQDFEHVAITLLFMGGGLVRFLPMHTAALMLRRVQCGMMLETKVFRITGRSEVVEPRAGLEPGYSLNPMPAITVLILGAILGGHHQNVMESTMMHQWVRADFCPVELGRNS
jgi:hypothetical protein